MPELILSYKGYSLTLSFPTKNYYMTKEFEPGKTLYQILFEHLIDGKAISLRGLAKQYKKVNLDISPMAIRWVMGKINYALKASPDKRLRKKCFIMLPSGGAGAVLLRKSHRARYTLKQRAIIEETLRKLHKQGRKPTIAKIRAACLNALHKEGLAKNIMLHKSAIRDYKKRLGLPLRHHKPKTKRRM